MKTKGVETACFVRFGKTLDAEFPLYIAITSHVLWLGLMWVDSREVASPDQLVSRFIVLVVLYAVMALFIGIARDRITWLMRRRAFHLVAAFCGAIGSVLLHISPSLQGPLSFALVAAGVILGALYLSFGTALLGEASQRREFSLPFISLFALVSALALMLFVVGALDAPAVITFLCITPFLTVAFTYKAQHDNVGYLKPQEFLITDHGVLEPKEGARWFEKTDQFRVSKTRFSIFVGRSAIPLGIAFGALLCAQGKALESLAMTQLAYEALLASVSSLLFTYATFKVIKSVDCRAIIRRVVCCTAAIVALSLEGVLFGGRAPSAAMVLSAIFLMGAMCWTYSASFSFRFRVSAPLAFGSFMGFLSLSAAAAFVALASSGASCALVTAFVSLAVGNFCVIDEKDMRKVIVANIDGDALPSDSEDSCAPEKEKRPFRQLCREVASAYALSERETEILFFLAKGRNAAYIQKECSIAEGTVRSHTRSIYAKLNVHTQQELMDVVDGHGREREVR